MDHTLCILVDAFRHDYLDRERTPVLSALARRGAHARLRPILGYSDAIRATIFTGALPDEHGYWMEYCHRPEAAPLRDLERLRALDRMPPDIVRRALKVALSKTVVRRTAKRAGYSHLSLRHFPFRSLGVFDWTLRASMEAPGALGVPTIFDELTAAGVKWRYLDAARDGRRALLRGLDSLEDDVQFTFVYLHHIDMASHLVGIESPLFRRTVAKTDALVGEVLRRYENRRGHPQLVVFSDHGMSAVKEIVAYPDLWKHPAFPDKFRFALDATMVRVWWEDAEEGLRVAVRDRIENGAPGRWLGREELRALHLDFEGRLYGDEIYLLEPGVAIFPNFHSMVKPKAMHAYHPDDPDQQGIFVGPHDHVVGDVVELADVHALCRSLAGLAQPARALAA